MSKRRVLAPNRGAPRRYFHAKNGRSADVGCRLDWALCEAVAFRRKDIETLDSNVAPS
jgi:hypothetical protein